jgi:hypothetical protein
MTALQQQLSDNHRRTSKMLAYALHADQEEIWLIAEIVWLARLTDRERVAMAFSVLRTLRPDQRELIHAAVSDDAAMPNVPLMSAMDEASSWADWANYSSIKACTLVGFNRLTEPDQHAFLCHVSERMAA